MTITSDLSRANAAVHMNTRHADARTTLCRTGSSLLLRVMSRSRVLIDRADLRRLVFDARKSEEILAERDVAERLVVQQAQNPSGDLEFVFVVGVVLRAGGDEVRARQNARWILVEE